MDLCFRKGGKRIQTHRARNFLCGIFLPSGKISREFQPSSHCSSSNPLIYYFPRVPLHGIFPNSRNLGFFFSNSWFPGASGPTHPDTQIPASSSRKMQSKDLMVEAGKMGINPSKELIAPAVSSGAWLCCSPSTVILGILWNSCSQSLPTFS